MGGLAKAVKKIVKKVKKIAVPVVSAYMAYQTGGLSAAAMSAAGSALTMGGKEQKADRGPTIQEQQQQRLLESQKAMQGQAQLKAAREEDELAKQLSASRRAIVARRSGRASLSFSGPSTGLKTTLGG